jgi:hypothetical protein
MRIFFMALLFLFLSSCGETLWERSQFENGYSIEHPDYMKSTTELKPGSGIQFENVNRELYYVLDIHSKSELGKAGVGFDLKAFSASIQKSMLEGLKKAWLEDQGEMKCGVWNANLFLIGGKTKFGPSITYMVMVVDAENDFLIQTAWTPSAQKTSWFNDDMKQMMQSLQKVNQL